MAEVPGIAGPNTTPPTSIAGELERLRAENELLRTRLSAAEIVNRERERRIEDLLMALRGLPGSWMRHLEREIEEPPASGSDQGRTADPTTVIEVVATSQCGRSVIEDAWKEIRLLRDRIEGERLGRELELVRGSGARGKSRPPPSGS